MNVMHLRCGVGWLFIVLLYSTCEIITVKGRVGISCKNQDGHPVDWFIGYKLPRRNSQSDIQRKRGYAFLYMDNATSGKWIQSKNGIDSDHQSVAFTLRQVYSNRNKANVFRLLYNDEWPQGNVSASKGHAKGVALFDSTSGFWLIHSVPKFPPKDGYGYPSTGAKYGQSFFCITFDYSMLPEIANQLYLYNPYIYDWSLPASMAKDIEMLAKVVNGQTQKGAPYNRAANLTSAGGVALTSFAKFKKWGKELYADFVAPKIERALFTETWQIGRGDLGPSCSAMYNVYDIKNVTVLSSIAFSNHEDHAKWAVSNETSGRNNIKSGRWICVGDINRQKEQLNRSGGTICMRNVNVWQTFRDSINDYARCPLQDGRK